MTTQTTITIIPAQAGWFVFQLYTDGGFGYDPIIAWEVERVAWKSENEGVKNSSLTKRQQWSFSKHNHERQRRKHEAETRSA